MQLLRKTDPSSDLSATAEFVVAELEWQVLGAEDAKPQSSGAAVAVPLSMFLSDPQDWTSRQTAWTLVIEPGDELGELANELLSVVLDRSEILISFPTFTDGRGYTHAATLRNQHGFKGDLVAVGDVRRDQLDFMHRSGFTGFEITGNDSVPDMIVSLGELSMPAPHRLYSGAAL